MLRNYLLAALRNIWKNKTYSFLNIFGLAVGVACAGLIFLWVEAELGYDPFPKKEFVYNVRTNQTYNGAIRTFNSSPGPLAAAMQAEIPGIVRTCRTREKKILFSVGDKSVYENGMYADSTLFGMFSMHFLEGGVSSAFRDLNSVVISETMARHFFGTVNGVIGRTMRVNDNENFTVSSVFRDFPLNSTVRPDYVIPFGSFEKDNDWLKYWGANGLSTFVELSPSADPAKVNRQLKGFIRQKSEQKAGAQPLLIGMKDWRLRNEFVDGKQSGGRIQFVRLFTYIACIILLIACINFMNLSTARSQKRAREVGVRKVLGAERGRLIGQFIGESILLSILSVVLGALLIGLVLPAFNLMVKEELFLGIGQPLHIMSLLAIALVCGLVAGSYPALYLSGFNPVHVLKRLTTKDGGAETTRKVLVVAQFAISIFLIVSTIIIYRQVQHIKSRDLGYNKDNLLDLRTSPTLLNNYEAVKQDLLQTGAVESTALCDMENLDISNNTSGYSWPGKDPNASVLISIRNINHDYIKTMGMQLIDGRGFRDDFSQDSGKVLITQALAKMMGQGSAVGKYLKSNNGNDQVIGVVKDYVYGDFYGRPDPVVFYSQPRPGYFYIRLRQEVTTEKALAAIGGVLKKDNPGYPFDYSWVDDKFNAKFTAESLIGKLSGLFSALAIFISCLGLFGLAAYTAEQRTREIGIRKVLGASVTGITGLLSKDFLKLVILSNVLALPLAAWALSRWLDSYAYRIAISWWMFAAAAITSVLIALATVGFQAVRAALMSPVKSLRSE
ncbi:MAG: ABC transporter permease [Bacteroidetes bacterium]|nr:ABC transporter permease [Bacteroidota bacterium]